MSRRTWALVAGGAAVAGSLLTAPSAAALPPNPLINTTCSFEQIQAAVRVEAPQFAERMAAKPEAEAKMREFLALPIDQRQARMQEKINSNPDKVAMIEEKMATPEGQERLQTMQRVADTCSTY